MRMIAPHPANTGGSRLATEGNLDKDLLPIPLHVAVRPAGELVAIIPPPCWDVMKLDVEGYEFRILRSLFAAATLRPCNILFEYLPREFDVGEGDLAWLKNEGYDLFTVEGRPYEPGTRPPDDNLWARHIN
jgi:hypothetical protein